MKLIRTEDGNILSKGKIICSAFNKEYCSPNWNEDIEKYLQTKIIAEADTIEDLSDEFVIINNVDKHPYRMSVRALNDLLHNNDDRSQYSGSSEICFDYAKEKFKAVKEFIGTKENHDSYANYIYEKNPDFELDISLYAYIWVVGSNGAPILKPVAKMNDKGELELL